MEKKTQRSIFFERKRPYLEARGRILRALRETFYREGFQEVTTPALQVSPGLEPHLQAFQTFLVDAFGQKSAARYLHTSPEFAMKKLLCSGMEKIFQVAQVFRNKERSRTHHPEFAMLEWYRAGAPYTQLMDDCETLLRNCREAAGPGRDFVWNEARADAFQPFERLSVQDAFLKHAGVNLLATIDDPLNPAPAKLREECKRLGIYEHASDTWEDLFFRISLEKIEPKLGIGVPIILYDYPISMAALSRPKPEAPHLAERFELYVCGLELANAFGELTDANAQRRRFEADMEKKQKLYGERYPIDEDFLAALEGGMPESSGIALGVDRLVMLATGATNIDDVLWISVAPVNET